MNTPLPYNEKVLLMQISRGNEKAFRTLYDHYYNRIYSVAFKLTKEGADAEDVVQEIFIKLWVNKDKLEGIDNFNAYLNTLIRHHVFNSLRRLANEEVYLQQMMKNEQPVGKDTFDTVVYNELRQRLRHAVSLLSPQQKRAYHLSRTEGLKHEEIAAQMNISRETVKKHISEALRVIKSHLDEEELSLIFLGILLFSA